jgi:synaptobrevin family protein YKT6
MKILYLGILKNESKPAIELCAETELSSFSRFTRGSYSDFLTFTSKTVAERTRPGQRQDVEEQSYTLRAYARTEGICGIIISDQEYPGLIAHQLLSNIIDEFISKHPPAEWRNSDAKISFPPLKEYITKYQDPQQASSIMKIQKELDETKIVLHKTIESVSQSHFPGDQLLIWYRFWKEARRQVLTFTCTLNVLHHLPSKLA